MCPTDETATATEATLQTGIELNVGGQFIFTKSMKAYLETSTSNSRLDGKNKNLIRLSVLSTYILHSL